MRIDVSRLSYLHQIVQTRPKTALTAALVALGAVWVYQKIPGIVRYGCIENQRSLVTIFSRFLSREQLKEISKKIIQEKNDLAFTNLLQCSPISTIFFEAVIENPHDIKMNCKVIKYLRDSQVVEVSKIIEFINLNIQRGARFYDFIHEGVIVSDILHTLGVKDIHEPVTGWETSLLCIAAAENNIDFARRLIAQGARLDEKRYHPDYGDHLYPFEFAGQLNHFEMVELLLVRLNGYECKSRKFIKEVVKERFFLFLKLVLRGLKIPQKATIFELVMQKWCERQHQMNDKLFKALAERLLPQMVGHLTFKTLDEFVQRVEVFFRAARCGCFDVNTPLSPDKKTLLHYAIQYKQHRLVNQLLDAGASPNDELFICEILNFLIFGSHLPQMSDAELQKRIKIVVSLSQKVNRQNHDDVFLFLTKSERIFRLLPRCEVIQGPIYKGGWTLMHWVAERGDHDRMRQLLAWGAPSNCQTEDYQLTPLYMAVCYNHIACILALASVANLVQIPSSSLIQVGWDRFAIIDENPFEYVVRLGRGGVIDLFIQTVNDPHIFLATLLKAVNLCEERENNSDYHAFLSIRLIYVLRDSKAVRASVCSLIAACTKFNEEERLSAELIQGLANHHPYLPYFQKVGYEKVYGADLRSTLLLLFTKNGFGNGLQSYGDRLIHNPAATKQEVLLFREACIVAERMHQSFTQTSLVFIQPMLNQLKTLLERSTPSIETSFEKAFDEKDGPCIVGEIFVGEDRQWMIQCAMEASSMGLLEGCDFRLIGIDNNLAALTEIVERDPTQQKRLSDEVTRKKNIFKRFIEHGLHLDLLSEEHSHIRRWEFEVNIALLKWVLTQKDKVQKLLEKKRVESLSGIENADIIGFLVGKKI